MTCTDSSSQVFRIQAWVTTPRRSKSQCPCVSGIVVIGVLAAHRAGCTLRELFCCDPSCDFQLRVSPPRTSPTSTRLPASESLLCPRCGTCRVARSDPIQVSSPCYWPELPWPLFLPKGSGFTLFSAKDQRRRSSMRPGRRTLRQ